MKHERETATQRIGEKNVLGRNNSTLQSQGKELGIFEKQKESKNFQSILSSGFRVLGETGDEARGGSRDQLTRLCYYGKEYVFQVWWWEATDRH